MSKKKLLLFTILAIVFVTIDLFGVYVAFSATVSTDVDTIINSNASIQEGKEIYKLESIQSELYAKKIPFIMESALINDAKVTCLLVSSDDTGSFTLDNNIITSSHPTSLIVFSSIELSGNPYWQLDSNYGYRMLSYSNNYFVGKYEGTISFLSRSYYNPNGDSLGKNDFVPPVPLSDTDLKDIPLNTLRIRKPSSSSQIDTTKNLIFADDDFFTWEVDGKIGLVGNYKDNINKIKNLNEYEINAMKPIFPNAIDITKNVSVEFLGNENDWITNGFITFKATGDVLLNKVAPVDNVSLTLGCNFVNQADGFLGSTRVYTWANDTVSFNLGLHTDVNGDGVDDNTGLAIPVDSPVDSDGDGKLDGGGSTDFIQDFTNTIKNIPSYTSDITIAFSNILGFLPQPLPVLVVGALATMIFVTVISFIRGN